MKPNPPQTPQQQQECHLDELGYCFVKKCIQTIEKRGLDDQGLYRIGGVNSRVSRLLQLCLNRKNYDTATGHVTMPDFSDPVEWETKTITSALKNYLRNLSEPLMTYSLHPSIIDAAKLENSETRTSRIKSLIQQLPIRNFTLLKILVEHLRNVASHSQKNLMTVSNLSICFAPTLMRGPEENTLSIMEIKYSNVVANTLIEEYNSIFNEIRVSNQMQQQSQRQQHYHQQQKLPYQPSSFRHNPSAPQLSYADQQVQISNYDDRFGLGLPSHQQYDQNNHHLQSSVSSSNLSHPNKPLKCLNGAVNDLAQFAMKSYDQHTSRPAPLISNSIPLMDLRPLNDLETYSFDQALMVPAEQRQYRHLSGSMNNSLNYIGYPGDQASSQATNSLKYSWGSLNNAPGDQYHKSNPINSFSYHPNISTKLPYSTGKVITLYACVADTESELSFGPNEVITDVRHSAEAGWLVGTLEKNGQRGLLPENYVKFI